MTNFLVVSTVALWVVVIAVGFLLLGTLRSLGLLQWRLEQLQATQPSRINREGLKPGKTAPQVSLPDTDGDITSLGNFAGRRVLLVFVQAGCEPCHAIAPELNRLQRSGKMQVLVINRALPEDAAEWAAEVRAEFPVLVQDGLEISKKYQVFATPFAFLIDEQGRIVSRGIVNNRQHIGFVLEAAENLTARNVKTTGEESGVETNGRSPSPDETGEVVRTA